MPYSQDAASNDATEPIKLESTVRIFFGSLLLLSGAGVLCWVLVTSLDLLAGNESIALMKLIPGLKEGMTLQAPTGEISIPPDAFVLVGYALVIMILSLIISIGSALLRSGSHLLQPEIRRKLHQILRNIKRLSD